MTLLSVSAAATAAWVFLKPAATVRSTLVVASNTPVLAFVTEDNKGDARSDVAAYQKTQAQLVTSRLVLTAALRNPQVSGLSIVQEQPNPIEWLEKEIKVENPTGTTLMQICLKGDRTDELTTLVNAITKAYLEEIVEKEKSRREQRLTKLKQVYDKAEAGLQRQREALKTLSEMAVTSDEKALSVAQQFALEQLNMAKKDRMQYHSERVRIEAELKVQVIPKAPQPVPPPDYLVEDALTKDPAGARLLQRIAQLEEKVEKTKERSARGEAEPLLTAPLKELASLKQSLNTRRKALSETLAKQQSGRAIEEAKATIAHQQDRVRVLKDLENSLEVEVKNLAEQARVINKSSFDLTSTRELIAKDEVVSRRLANEMEALKVEIEAPLRVTQLEEASVSWAGAEKKRMMGLGAGVFAALALSLFGVGWTELRARRVTRAQDVVDHLGVRLVGSIPYLDEHRAQRRLGSAEEMPDPLGQKIMTESIDTVRTMLLHLARVDSLRVVMMTSALSGEGKTSVACHLAASLARSGRKTLLIDCDLRKPTVHRLFDLPMGHGFSDLLQGTAQLGDVIQATPVEGLSVIPAGLCDAGALRALAQDGARQVFERLRGAFDFIIVDSSPVLPVVDSLLLAQHTDGVLFSLLRDVSRMPTAQAALKKLEALGVRLLGAVVSGTEHEDGYYHAY